MENSSNGPVCKRTWHEALGLAKRDVISVVGSGGKTTLCLELCRELKQTAKVCFTTTTKIYVPDQEEQFYLHIGSDCLLVDTNRPGVYVIGDRINEEQKLSGPAPEVLREMISRFDYTVIEADGAKRKPLKGWNDHEPVYAPETTKTVGVIPIYAVGLPVRAEYIHRLEQFCAITGAHEGDLVTMEMLCRVVCHEQGLFKSAPGQKILVLNQSERAEDEAHSRDLGQAVRKLYPEIGRIICAAKASSQYWIMQSDIDIR